MLSFCRNPNAFELRGKRNDDNANSVWRIIWSYADSNLPCGVTHFVISPLILYCPLQIDNNNLLFETH